MAETILWHAQDIALAVAGQLNRGAAETDPITEVVIDSRQAGSQILFIALRGERIDSHQFIPDLLKQSGGLFIVEQGHPGLDEKLCQDGRLIFVKDSLKALWDLGIASRQRAQGLIFSITGSVGKTSAKEMLAHILVEQGVTSANRGNLNNHYGAPLSCARMPAEADFGVFELGMNHAGELQELTQIVKPHIAMITQIAPAHMAFFDSLADVAHAKSEIIEGIVDGGAIILNQDAPHYDILRRKAEKEAGCRDQGLLCLTIGRDDSADAQLLSAEIIFQDQRLMTRVQAVIFGEQVTYDLGLPGAHQVMNSLAVLLACAASDKITAFCPKQPRICLTQAMASLSALSGLAGRGKIQTCPWQGGHITLIDESYNASPSAVIAAIDVLKQIPTPEGGRRIAVLGDMLEMGDQTLALHQQLDTHCDGLDLIYAIGPNMTKMLEMRPENQQGGCVLTSEDLREKLTKDLRSGDIVLIKGSLGMKMSLLVDIFQETSSA